MCSLTGSGSFVFVIKVFANPELKQLKFTLSGSEMIKDHLNKFTNSDDVVKKLSPLYLDFCFLFVCFLFVLIRVSMLQFKIQI